MSMVPYINGNVSIPKNNILFYQDQDNNSVNILLKGKVNVMINPFETSEEMSEKNVIRKSYKLFSLEQGTFIGTNDLFLSRNHSLSYVTSENSVVYCMITENMEDVKALLDTNKDYAAYMISSISQMVDLSCIALEELNDLTRTLQILTGNLTMFLWMIKETFHLSYTPTMSIFEAGSEQFEKTKEGQLGFPAVFLPVCLEEDYWKLFQSALLSAPEFDSAKMDYYKHLYHLPASLRKSFFREDFIITQYHCGDAANLLSDIQDMIKTSLKMADELFRNLYTRNKACILSEYLQAAQSIESDKDLQYMTQVLAFITDKIDEITAIFKNRYDFQYDVDPEYLNNIRNLFNPSEQTAHKGNIHLVYGNSLPYGTIEITNQKTVMPEILKDSAKKILEYSNISQDSGRLFWNYLSTFRSMPDKLSADSQYRSISQNITPIFFEIYEAVFKRALQENNHDPLFDMFLKYAYMDERLLDIEHILALYELSTRPASNGQYSIFNMREWLTMIYNMERDPSLNEFGQDYFDIFREAKRHGKVSIEDKPKYDNDRDGRLRHEIQNLLRINQKTCYGYISTYFPILHNNMIAKDLIKSFVSPSIIEKGIERVLEIDFSAFHREVLYTDPGLGITKEFIMKPVQPEFILIPTYGSREVVWQDITGRSRVTPGRLLLPMFTAENVDALLVRLVGSFRWDLCRTMMGLAWNDITEKSITSEYTDYMQFYKNNRDLSDEAKQKLKSQILRCRSSTRELFTADYETWINYESKGAIRLNQIARSILFRHCPFSKNIRDSLEKHPLFKDLAIRLRNTRNKKAKEIEGRYRKYVKAGTILNTDLEHNLHFYKDM